jgi:hypothetical protein
MDAALKALKLQLRESYQSFTGEFITGRYNFTFLSTVKIVSGR